MTRENEVPSSVRLLLGLLVGVLVGVTMGQGVDFIATETSVMASVLSVIIGLLSTYLLRLGMPRREKPSTMGTIGLLLVLACYLVIGNIVLASSAMIFVLMYGIAGAIMAWLIFTSIAESSLLYAFGIGGFCGGFGGVLVPMIFSGSFAPLLNYLTTSPSEKTIVATYLALICTIPGAFAAVAGRLSGWGLLEHTKEDVWAFNSDGRLYVKQTTR
ncbi:MAG: hypothetical protein ACI38Q_05725 [Candidatus Bruticola sp.]